MDNEHPLFDGRISPRSDDMATIVDSYTRLADETTRPCYSVTFWRTADGRWGARAGLGTHEFGTTIEEAIESAVTNAIAAQTVRQVEDSRRQSDAQTRT